MKILRSILSIRYRAMFCFLVGVCVSPALIQWIQASMLGARANDYGAFVQEPGAGKEPNTKQTLPTQSSGETILPAGETILPGGGQVTDATIPSDPKGIVRLFLDSMRKNDQIKMRQLLSSLAREELKRAQLEIAPLGSAKATYQVLNAVEESDHTLVESVWEEPKPSSEATTLGESKSLEVIWELRKESQGWRICGMAVDPKDGNEVQVVDFENLEPSDVKSNSLISESPSTNSIASGSFDSNPHSDPKTVTKLFVEAVVRRDVATLWALLSTRARAEIKWSDNENHLMQAIGFNGGNGVFSSAITNR